jgi:bifunctional DNA-binding transcriptional regulator/antitoxin component of YhaV-PrlF toxin-antitoxin module
MAGIRAKVTQTGRLSFPAELRKAVGLEHGGNVVVELAGNELRIRTVDEVVARAQDLTRQLLSGHATATVDGFLAERRREAQGE